MKKVRPLALGLATLISVFPLVWLTLMTYGAIANVEYFGWIDEHTGGYLIASIACWSAFVASITFCVLAWKHNISVAIQVPWIVVSLIAGVVGDLALFWFMRDNPKIWFPPTFFVWPAAAFLGAGLICGMLPNPSLRSGRK